MAEAEVTKRNKPAAYQSYLLRLWRNHPQGPWQASLQSTATEQIQHFAGIDQMWAFLKAQLGLARDDPEALVEAEQDAPD